MAITEISVSKIYVLATEPTNKIKDRFWFDTTNNILKRYDGTTWKPISVSSDDVVVLSNGNKISLTSYLNTQIAALAEGIDSKQDKLYFYTEKIGNFIEAKIQTEMGYIGIKENTTINAMNSVNIDSSNGDTNIGTVKYDNINASTQKYTKSKLALKSTGITLDLNKTDSSDDSNIIDIDSNLLTIDTTDTEVTTLSGSLISNSISSNSSDYKLPTEKAVYDVVSGKQDKLKYYSESEYDANITNNAGDIYISTPGGIMGISANTISLNGDINGNTIHTAISSTPSDNKLLSEKAISTSLSSKQDKLTKYIETTNSATIDNSYIFSNTKLQITEGKYIQLYDGDFFTNYNPKSIEVKEAYSGAGDTNFTIKNNIIINGNLTSQGNISAADISASNNINYSGSLLKDGVDVLSLKQNSTDDSLNTTNKTIVGAINELLSSINTNVITSTEQKRITTTSTSAGIQMSTTAKTCMVSINPVKTNVGAIYISTSSDTAPTINPLYPDQMPKYKFPDASQVYIWSDVNGDSVDLTIEYYG